jgi:protein ImuB
MCPSLLTLPVDPGRDAIEFEPVAVAAESVVAGLEVIRPGLALLPASGAARYYGTELELTSQLTEAVSVAGFECQVGIADGILAAVVAAQEQVIVPPGGSAQFLAPRPITDLTAAHPVDFQQLAEALSLWARLGLRTLGDLVALPAAAVAARFGEIGVWARRLAAGGDLRPPSARLVTADVTVSLELDPPAQQVEAAMLAGQQLAQDFAAVMLERSLACG